LRSTRHRLARVSRSIAGVCLVASFGCRSTSATSDSRQTRCVPAGKTASPSDVPLWRGAVILPNSSRKRQYFVDGVPLATKYVDTDTPVIDTLTLPNGLHQIRSAPSPWPDPSFQETIDVENPPAASFAGQFVELTPESTGLPGPTPGDPMSLFLNGAVAADFDGDGKVDLFVWSGAKVGDVYLQDTPMHFHALGLNVSEVNSAAAGDLDNDGRPDLIVAGATIHLLHNTGRPGQLFEDLTVAAGVPPDAAPQLKPGDPSRKAYQGITLADIDDDGLLDIAIAEMNCTGGVNVVLRNEGDFHFGRIDDQLGLTYAGRATFDILMDRLEPGGPLIVWPYFEGCLPSGGTVLHKYPGGPDLPGPPTLTRAETMSGSMGSVYTDTNGDGVLDLWSSGTEFSPMLLGPEYVEDVAGSIGLQTFPDPRGHVTEQWGVAALDADMDGKIDLLFGETAYNPDVAPLEQPHYRLARQSDLCEWRDSSAEAGLSSLSSDCEALQAADLDGDGDSDVLVGCYGSLRLLRNDLAPHGLGRTVVLHGTLSNPDGVSAMLSGPSGEKRLVRGGGQPFAGGVVHESLRASGGSVHVVWPSGIEQTVDAGDAPVLHITEPELFRLGSRRVPAGGPSSVTVEVDPSVVGPAEAPVQVASSAGGWTMPLARQDDGVWRGEVLVPGGPSVVVLTITVGSKTFAVRPRIFVR
jgi:hypothetical protein